MDAVSCFFLGFIFKSIKEKKLPFSTLGLVEILASIGLIFLIPQFIGEQMYGKEIKFNKAFFLILSFVTLFASIGAYYSWNKAIELIGPNRASIFFHLMPVFGVDFSNSFIKRKISNVSFHWSWIYSIRYLFIKPGNTND